MAKAYYGFCPCKGCDKRFVGCHALCDRYKEWSKNGKEIIEPFIDYGKKVRRRRKKE